MREILFRGKRISDGSWVHGGIMKTFHPNFNHESPEAFNLRKENCYCICTGGKDIFVEQSSIEQYTGLTDKNGKKIFEGDICDFSILGGDHVFVKITIQYGCVGFEPLDYDDVHPDDQKWTSFWKSEEDEMWNTDYFTVIGNIHDNPELLKGEQIMNYKVSSREEVKCNVKEPGIYGQTKQTRQILTEVLFMLDEFKREIRDYKIPEGEKAMDPVCFKDEVMLINSLALAIRGDLTRLMDEFR